MAATSNMKSCGAALVYSFFPLAVFRIEFNID
jgi:hypothetical protein